MDDYVCNKLTEWGFSNLIKRFKDEEIDEEVFENIKEKDIDELISKVGLRVKFKRRLELLKHQQALEGAAGSVQAGPSTSGSSHKGGIQISSVRKEKRKSDLPGNQPPTKRQRDSDGPLSEEDILSNVKRIMENVKDILHLEDDTKSKAFLMKKIDDLKIDKRELIGVFGRIGAGKSSLINAVIGEFNLLPTGMFRACTSVMIKVEANMKNDKYEAEIEFIRKEQWTDELCLYHNHFGNNEKNNDDEDYRDIADMLSAVYGEDWENISPENFMDNKYFKDIPEFQLNSRKTLKLESAEELSDKLVQYTTSEFSEGTEKRWYWPLVKCVTVRVPNNPLLQHVTLVDLPGCGDRNKSRDRMWKEFVGSCSTVWIVTEIHRAAADKEAWEILESASSLIGNGGQCQRIHFICTKTDHSKNWKNEIMKAKEVVLEEFNRQNTVKKHFSNECFKVFTVSSTEFQERTFLQPDETEIPQLQEFLRNLNDCHSETFNYVSDAYGILSWMQGARSIDTADSKTEVYSRLEEKLQHELQRIKKTMEEIYEAFEERLTEGVKNSESSCEELLQRFLYPRQKGSGFHRTLMRVVDNSGVHKTTKGKPINLNAELSSKLTDSIDEMFRNTFPNERKCSPFHGVISEFSLDTEKLIDSYKALEWQLIFLKREEERIKTRLNEIICDRKIVVYSCLTEMITGSMQFGYKRAAEFRGCNFLEDMRKTLEKHLHDSKNTMFKNAKENMLLCLQKLMKEIKKTLKETLNEAIKLSFETNDHLILDFSAQLELVKQYYRELEARPNEEI